MAERWKKVEGVFWKDFCYEVSDQGNVRRTNTLTKNYKIGNAPRVALKKVDGKVEHVRIDKLVADAFGVSYKGERPEHKNGDQNDCRLANLR